MLFLWLDTWSGKWGKWKDGEEEEEKKIVKRKQETVYCGWRSHHNADIPGALAYISYNTDGDTRGYIDVSQDYGRGGKSEIDRIMIPTQHLTPN